MNTIQNFEWDDVKRHANIEKHKIDFVLASQVFEDPLCVEWSSEHKGETRYITIGTVHGNTTEKICVIWTKRGINKRIISARKASQNERKTYEG